MKRDKPAAHDDIDKVMKRLVEDMDSAMIDLRKACFIHEIFFIIYSRVRLTTSLEH